MKILTKTHRVPMFLTAALLLAVLCVFSSAKALADSLYINVSLQGTTQDTAIEVVSGEMYYKTWGTTGSTASSSTWNKVILEEGGFIGVSAAPSPYYVDYAIYDGNAHKLLDGSISPYEDMTHFDYGLKAGVYYVKFSNDYSQNSLFYSILIMDGVPSEAEPNDMFSTATPIEIGEKYRGSRSGVNSIDSDYYSFSLGSGSAYRVAIDYYEEIGKPSIYLYESDRSSYTVLPLAYDSSTGQYAYEFICTETGTYYINLRLWPGEESGSYVLQIHEACPDDVDLRNYKYTISGGGAIIEDYSGPLSSLAVPAELGGFPVVGIAENAFRGNTLIEKVTLPSSIEWIGDYAFEGCGSLSSINLTEGLEEVGFCAFDGCESLAELTLPTTLHTFGHYAFDGLAKSSTIFILDDGPWDQYGLLSGSPELFFDPNRTSLVLISNPEYGMGVWRSFPDVMAEVEAAGGPENVWYVNDGWLDYVVSEGLMGGYASNGWFGPYDPITRGQVATILYRAECAKDPSLVSVYGSTTDPAAYAQERAFDDMLSGEYYTAAVNWAKAAGVMTGDSSTNYTTVRPDDPVARQELCLMLARYANGGAVPATALDPEKAAGILGMGEVADWAEDGVSWAVNHGVIGGVDNHDGTFSMNPLDTTWRAAAAKMFTVVMRDVIA